MIKYSLTMLCVIFMIGLVAGCGFHLAGGGKFSDELSNTHVQRISSSKEMLRHLEKNLRANQINVVKEGDATALFRLLNEENNKAVTTVDSDGKAREFELFLQVTFEIKSPENKVLLAKQTISLSRNFVFDKNNLLGANEEESKLLDEMRNDAARLMVYRLQTF